MKLLATSAQLMGDAGFVVGQISVAGRAALKIESPTVLGFIFAYENPNELILNWSNDADAAVANHQFGLRRAGEKAWNTYMVLLAKKEADYAGSVRISAIEEDLRGTRKIVRAGVFEAEDVRSALLPLLPVQAAPQLDAVDMRIEIRQRATELPEQVLKAFLSNADIAGVIQALEETQ